MSAHGVYAIQRIFVFKKDRSYEEDAGRVTVRK
jgi:hypothetical protein